MNRYTELAVQGYEKVLRCDNEQIDFSAWIAVHNSSRGPALGGCRLWNYHTDEAAFDDVLRLSRGMSYKNSLAGLFLGGGKSVVRVNLETVDRQALFEAMGDFVEQLEGDYIVAEGVNSTVEDMAVVKRKTKHVATVGASGNPSPFTAYGVYCAIKAACLHRFGNDDLSGRTVAIQGVGETGSRLAKLLYKENCRLFVTDINPDNLHQLQSQILCTSVTPEEIVGIPCDILSPCALGAILNPNTIAQLNCRIIAGSANNQLSTEEAGILIHNRGILYVPDYAANAGGVINISCEIGQAYNRDKAYRLTSDIAGTVEKILNRAAEQNIPTSVIADSLAAQSIGCHVSD
jgi:leucine dehydrogenase